MPDNRIDAVLSPEDREAVLAALKTITDKLPFLTGLTSEQIRELPKVGDKGVAFVKKALEVAEQNPDMLPRSFDTAAFRRDVELFEALTPLRLALAQVAEKLESTGILVGSEAYAAALLVYQYAKVNGKSEGLEGTLDELGRRFARKSKAEPPPNQA